MDDIAQRTIEIIAKAKNIPTDTINLDTTFEELNIDSLDKINISFEVEEAFDIAIPDEALGSLKTVGDVVRGVQQLVAGQDDRAPLLLPQQQRRRRLRSPVSNVNRVVITGLGCVTPIGSTVSDFRESLFSGNDRHLSYRRMFLMLLTVTRASATSRRRRSSTSILHSTSIQASSRRPIAIRTSASSLRARLRSRRSF